MLFQIMKIRYSCAISVKVFSYFDKAGELNNGVTQYFPFSWFYIVMRTFSYYYLTGLPQEA